MSQYSLIKIIGRTRRRHILGGKGQTYLLLANKWALVVISSFFVFDNLKE